MGKFKRWKIITLAIVLFIVAPVALYWLVCTPNPWGWGFIKPEDTGAWLGFYGAVLGGSLTFGGVWWTIRENRKQKIEDISIQFKPIVLFKRRKHNEEQLNDLHIAHSNEEGIFEIYLYNNGRGEAVDLMVYINDKHIRYDILSPCGYIKVSLPVVASDLHNLNPYYPYFTVTCEYRDLFNENNVYRSSAKILYKFRILRNQANEYTICDILDFSFKMIPKSEY